MNDLVELNIFSWVVLIQLIHFNFLTYPSICIASKGGPLNEMNYWLNTINLFGGENKTYDEILFN
jgi:hypothetical protein